ncbi:MAG TPA: hypothetical protein VJI98_00850 [Candidatus Nanoarchaeia archaeon]|nr:hypothetical protein [Candidatus Nanoarchaeia archaeon]
MGSWAKSLFNKENFSNVGIIVAGTNSPEFEQKILSYFERVIFSKDSVYHAHLALLKGKEYPIVFNVYGAPALVDVLTEMHDGGCRNVVLVGYAYGGFKNLEIGEIVLPSMSYHFDGIYHALKLDKKAEVPDKDLRNILKELLDKYVEGVNISVPAVTFQLPHIEYKELDPITVEMETAACFSRSKEIGIRSAAILVISDNKKDSINDDRKKEIRRSAKEKVLKLVIENLEQFDLPDLGVEFKIDEYLANVIADPDDTTNVYKKNNAK